MDDHKGLIHLRARFEGPDGIVGDAFDEIKPGQNFRNLTYDQLKRAGAGTIRVNADGSLTMTSDPLG
jgi:hypothetical protein